MKTSPSSFRSRRLLPVAAVLVSLALGFAARVGAVPVPATVPQNNFPSPNLPPPTGIYVSTQNVFAVYANGVIVKDVSLLHPSASQPPPVLGGAPVTQNFDASVRMTISTDGGVTFSAVTAPAQASMRIRAAAFSTPQLYDTEMLALNIAGGTLPGGVMFRESPTKQSLGGTTVRQPSTGGAVIASFFDIFTELSVNGGATWFPAQQAGNVELRVIRRRSRRSTRGRRCCRRRTVSMCRRRISRRLSRVAS